MAQIPFELVLDILDRSHFTKTDFPDYGTLRSLSLACKALERPSQKALFRNVYLARPKNASAFLRATEGGTEKGHWLASAVRFLNIRVEHTRNADKKHISILTFVTIFLRCTQLQEIKMRTEHYHPAFLSCWGTDNSLSECAPNTLRTITAPDYRFALALLKACPQITSLSLGSARSPTPADVQLFQTRNLVEIQWFGSATVLAQLLQRNDNAPEYSSLEILGLRNIRHADSPSVTSVLQMVGKSLRSLRLQSIPSELCDTIRSHLLNLEEFILDQFPTEIILESLPRKTMKHLEILSHVHVDHKDARGIRDWIRSTPGLEAVTWNVSRGAGAVVDTQIQDAWGDIGALLRVCPEPFGYFQNEVRGVC
ncbi:hypothetical protein FRC02_005419 [Tulasnella sp. 418]|nr:hypothetical protein FRC02_005419 [Tulasnella sp. 418]